MVVAVALMIERCALLAVEASQNGDLQSARSLLQQALAAIDAHSRM
jgi:hypothetical protein